MTASIIGFIVASKNFKRVVKKCKKNVFKIALGSVVAVFIYLVGLTYMNASELTAANFYKNATTLASTLEAQNFDVQLMKDGISFTNTKGFEGEIKYVSGKMILEIEAPVATSREAVTVVNVINAFSNENSTADKINAVLKNRDDAEIKFENGYVEIEDGEVELHIEKGVF